MKTLCLSNTNPLNCSVWIHENQNALYMVQAWIEIHRDELMADWDLAVVGEQIYKIDPFK